MEDDWIVTCILRKKEKGLELLIDQYGGLITSIIRKYLGTLKSYEEECVNDVLIAVWHHIHRFDSEKNTFENWVAAVAKYKAIDYQRKYIKTQREAESSEVEGVHNVQANDVEELLCHLNEGDRELFKAYCLQEVELKQIAQKQQTSISNLYNRLSHGRKKLDDGQVLLGLTIGADEFRRTALGLNRDPPIRLGELRVKIGKMSFFDSASSITNETIKNKDGSWSYLYALKLTQADTDGDGKIDVHGYNVLDHIDPNKTIKLTLSSQASSLKRIQLILKAGTTGILTEKLKAIGPYTPA